MAGVRITSTVTGVDEACRALTGTTRLTRAHTRKRLAFWGRRLVSSIRGDSGLFTSDHGVLKASLWTERSKDSAEPAQEIGWGVPYGEVLEWGPARAREWKIRPRGFRSDVTHGRSGGGKALARLRFVAKGKVVYAREVTHRWTEAERRPHFAPWLDHITRFFLDDMLSINARVIAGELT